MLLFGIIENFKLTNTSKTLLHKYTVMFWANIPLLSKIENTNQHFGIQAES